MVLYPASHPAGIKIAPAFLDLRIVGSLFLHGGLCGYALEQGISVFRIGVEAGAGADGGAHSVVFRDTLLQRDGLRNRSTSRIGHGEINMRTTESRFSAAPRRAARASFPALDSWAIDHGYSIAAW